MTSPRTILATGAVALTALVSLAAAAPAHAGSAAPAVAPAHAVAAAAAADAGPSLDLSADPDTVVAKRCRWVRRIGLVCDTELSTVNI